MPQPDADAFLPAIRRARFGQLVIYEISDTELQLIERGSPDSVFLTFGIFLISIGVSFLVTLLSTAIESIRIFTTFVVVSTIGMVTGLILLGLWWWYRKSRSDLFRTIRERLPQDGEAVPLLIGTEEQ
ncbi:hypothetical protein [Methylobacterium sp.]|jgi:uncharacterized membrane protein YqjE|uniref:hypothetical protein n=1 Tax=Methylobacterium sp. TaxID=409 RepID=UPI0015C81464|nr:hypothetical protein [Methylobacterium sp.]